MSWFLAAAVVLNVAASAEAPFAELWWKAALMMCYAAASLCLIFLK